MIKLNFTQKRMYSFTDTTYPAFMILFYGLFVRLFPAINIIHAIAQYRGCSIEFVGESGEMRINGKKKNENENR